MPGRLILASEKKVDKEIGTKKDSKKCKISGELVRKIHDITNFIVVSDPHYEKSLEYQGFHNIIYMNTSKNPTINKIASINVIFDMKAQGAYDTLVEHITKPFIQNGVERYCNMEYNTNQLPVDQSIIVDGIAITVNSGMIIGYYIPKINSFVVGEWTWHKHYAEVVIPYIWPQIKEELKKLGYDV